MTEHKKRHGSQVAPTTVIERTQDLAALTPEEEKALRMAHGLTERDDHILSFALGADQDTRLKLAMMEKQLIEAFKKSPGPDLQLEEQHMDAKARIIDRLKNQ